MPVISYQEMMAAIERDEVTPSVLLANGFSRAWNTRIFNYQNLLLAANFGERDQQIRALFARSGTYDFETVMSQLVSAATVCEVYGFDADLLALLRSDQEALKTALISAISHTHPHRPNDVRDEQYVAVRTFLSRFEQIFTVNYDLLMYWARNKGDLAPEDFDSDDGFRAPHRWSGYSTRQNVHFLHGGLHIYDSGAYVKKHVFRDWGATIIDQVRENLEDGKFPLFVSEPSYEAKLRRIEHNPYLSYCFRQLKELSGSFIIFGHSMEPTDKHIFDQIRASNVSTVYVSIFGDINSVENVTTRANAAAFLTDHRTNVVFFDAATAPVWELVAEERGAV